MEREKNLNRYVYRMILTSIYNGTYGYQAKLPTLPALCKQYGVGRNTIRSALKDLETDGYIIQQQGTKAVVTFNFCDLESNLRYRQTLRDTMDMTEDVYETFELIFPALNVTCFEYGNNDNMEGMYALLERFDPAYIHNETELIESMNDIYLYVIRLSNNPIMLDLVRALLSHVYQPLTIEKQSIENTRRSTRGIRNMVTMVLHFARNHQLKLVKNAIQFMCIMHRKSSMRRLNAICKGLESEQSATFVWVCNRNQEYLYATVMLDIISDIVYGKYQMDEILPSIDKLSQRYEVSTRTIRSTLEILRQYKVIETINGVGSKVILECFDVREELLKQEEIQYSLHAYANSLQVLMIILKAIQSSILKKAKKEDLQTIVTGIESMQFQTLEPLCDYIFQQTNACLYTIYQELLKTIKWKSFCTLLIGGDDHCLLTLRKELITSLKKGSIQEICKKTLRIMKIDMDQLQGILRSA